MQSILQEICHEMIDEVFSLIETKDISNLMHLSREIRAISDRMSLNVLKTVIEKIDAVLLESKALRREDRIQVQAKNVPRTVETFLGELTFERTYYHVRDTDGKNRYVYLTDQVIGLESYERISKDLIAMILTDAAEVSYRTAVRRQDSSISAQTVHDRLMASKECAAEAEKAEETPEVLDLFADEDHVHMRNGKSAAVPLVAVTEGIDQSQKRHRTIRPFFMEGYGVGADAFRENLLAVLTEKYDLERVKEIRLHCDGGNWIQRIADLVPNVMVYMDEYHIEKYMKFLQNRAQDPEQKRKLRNALEKNDPDTFFLTGVEIARALTAKETEKVHESLRYFQNNWETIQNRKQAKDVCGSCTEGLVGNLLSARLSRNPMGWSHEGLRKMAALRIYWKNGYRLTPEDIRVSRKKQEISEKQQEFRENGFSRYAAYAEKQTKEFLQSRYNWSIFDPVQEQTGKRTGTEVILKALGSIHDTFASA